MLKLIWFASLFVTQPLYAMESDATKFIVGLAQYSVLGALGSFTIWNWYHNKKEIAATKQYYKKEVDELRQSNAASKREYEDMCLRVLSRRLHDIVEERFESEKRKFPEKTASEISKGLLKRDLDFCKINEDLNYLWEFIFGKDKLTRQKLMDSLCPDRPRMFEGKDIYQVIKDDMEEESGNLVFTKISGRED